MFRSSVLVLGAMLAQVFGQSSKLMPDYKDHPCIRPCEDGGAPMECRYHFVAESYQTLSRACYECATKPEDCLREHCVPANGFSRNIKTINRAIPGPGIQVCQGDVVIVDLENQMSMVEGLTIHWHGILQKLTPHMDGVGMITQCPIQAYTSFQYRFVALDPGTHFWHAHTGMQRGEGLFGSVIVRQPPSQEPHFGKYDFDLPEHVIIVNEWQNKPLIEIYTSYHHGDGPQQADAILINGRTGENTNGLELPRTSFDVEPGKKYRFRVINSGSLFCPIQISVDNHNLTIIAADGWPFEPFVVESFDLYSAERMDFILEADQPVGTYWLRAAGLGTCDSNDLNAQAAINYVAPANQKSSAAENRAQKVAALTQKVPAPPPTDVPFNHWPLWSDYQKDLLQGSMLGDSQSQLIGRDAVAPDDDSLKKDPDVQFILEFQMNEVPNTHFFDPDLYPAGQGPYRTIFSPQINHITNKLGPVPLLSQMNEIPENQFCDSSTIGPECETDFCECIHRLRVNFNQVVEIVFLDPFVGSGFTHPIHLHGYGFRVVAMTRVNEPMTAELFREMDSRGEVERKLSKAPLKDTVVIPNGGYTVIRLQANNPGVWFFHCHLAFHVEIGMSVVLEVLDENGGLPPPPGGFPTCGPYVAPEQQSDQTRQSSQNASPSKNSLGAPSGNPKNPPTDTAHSFSVQAALGAAVGFLLLVILALSVAHLRLRQKTKKRLREERNVPTYASNAESQNEAFMGDGNDVVHFEHSRKQERMGLTKRPD